MAIDAASLANNIKQQMGAPPRNFTGKTDFDLSMGIALGLFAYLKTPNLVSFQLSGTAGPVGSQSSIVISGVVASSMSSLIRFRAPFTGKNWGDLCDAIANGFAITFQSGTINGTTAGIAVGAGIGRFLNVQDSDLAAKIKQTANFKQIQGRDKDKMVDAIAFGICTHLKTSAIVSATVTGAIAPVPPVGPISVSAMPTIFNIIV